MKNKKLIIIFIVFAIIVLVGSYILLFNGKKDEAFLKLEKITLKEEKKVKVKDKELTLKLDDGLLINGNKLDIQNITNVYNTGEYLIVCYQGTEKEKLLFINSEGKVIEIVRENVNEEAEFSNLKLDENKLTAETNNEKVTITYTEGKINIKK